MNTKSNAPPQPGRDTSRQYGPKTMLNTEKLNTEKQPKTKRGEATRKKILAAAEQEIGSKGFSEASISSITTAAGVGQGTFYIYFNSKEEVLRALVTNYSQTIRHHLTEAVAKAPTRIEKERLGLKTFIDYVREHRNFYLIIHEALFIDPEIYQDYYLQFSRAYTRRLDKACEEGEIKSVNTEVCSWALMGMSEFIGYRYGILDQDTPSEDVVDAVFSMLEKGLMKE